MSGRRRTAGAGAGRDGTDLGDKVRAMSAVYGLIGEGRGRTSEGRVVSLIKAVAKGRPRERSPRRER